MMGSFLALLPYAEVSYVQGFSGVNSLGTFFGGRIATVFPGGFVWYNGATAMYCPPHIWIISYGAPYRGPLPLLIPPAIPKSHYNWYTPGNAVKGAYSPTPIPPYTLCPYGVFPTTMMGTSVVPG
jgi:hypothetical protein